MPKRFGPWVFILVSGLSLAAFLTVPVTTTGAQPDPVHTFLYLPLVVKPVPPPNADPFLVEIWVGPDCAGGSPAYSGPSPAVVSGQVTHINVSTHIFNALNNTNSFTWQLNGSPFSDFGSSDSTLGNIHYVASHIYSSPPTPCVGQVESGTYLIQLYVDNQLVQSGSVTVN